MLTAITQRIFTFYLKLRDEWPQNSPDLSPLDCHVWAAMLQAFHKLNSKLKTITELKSVLIRYRMSCRGQRSTELFTTFAND